MLIKRRPTTLFINMSTSPLFSFPSSLSSHPLSIFSYTLSLITHPLSPYPFTGSWKSIQDYTRAAKKNRWAHFGQKIRFPEEAHLMWDQNSLLGFWNQENDVSFSALLYNILIRRTLSFLLIFGPDIEQSSQLSSCPRFLTHFLPPSDLLPSLLSSN